MSDRILRAGLTMAFVAVAGWSCSSSTEAADDAGPVNDAVTASDCVFAHGGAMQRVEIGGDRFCIDKTEVTRTQYDEFVRDGAPAEASPPPSCEDTKPKKPGAECMADPWVCNGSKCGEHPQVCISLCDASAYCAWAGKSLCGAVGSGKLVQDTGDITTPTRWELVCGHGLDNRGRPARDYPYSADYDAARCNVETGTTTPVGSQPRCGVVEYPEVVDMSGSVTEYNGRVTLTQTTPFYTATGGYFVNEFGSVRETSELVRCGTVQSGEVYPNGIEPSGSPTVGFRCCAD